MHPLQRFGIGRLHGWLCKVRTRGRSAIGGSGGNGGQPLGSLRVLRWAVLRHGRVGEEEDAAAAGHRPSAGSGG